MPFVSSPLPQSLPSEINKATQILRDFIRPTEKGPDSIIPSNILEKCRGLAILSVIKVGFIWSGRAGSGVIMAKLPNGRWSAPSAIATAGMGFGGQIGGEITDFVFILNTQAAVDAFAKGGNLTLGGNLSVAIGPVGRTVEAGGSLRSISPLYSYSKSKGAFAGISLEGSALIERRDANASFYGQRISARRILCGEVEPPREADALYAELNARIQGTATSTGQNGGVQQQNQQQTPIATASQPQQPFKKSNEIKARVLYDFRGQRPEDLNMKQGDIVTVIEKTESQNDWWKGSLNGKSGMVSKS